MSTAIEQSAMQLVADAAGYYDLGHVAEIRATASGWANRNYFVDTDTGQYVIKQILEHTEPEVLSEAAYIQRAAEARLPAIPYLPAANGSVTHTTANGELVVAMRRANGEHPRQTMATAAAIGTMFAHLHTVPSIGLPERHTWLDQIYLPQGVARIRERFGNEATAYEQALASLPQARLYELPSALIHGDMDSSNCLFEHGEPGALLDWEEAGANPALLDLASCIQNFCYDDNTLNTERTSAMIRSYNTVRHLTGAEHSYLAAAIGHVGLTLSVWSKLQFGDRPEAGNGSKRLYWDRQLDILSLDI